MSVTSGRSVNIEFSGDVEYSQEFSAADVSTGSGQNQVIALLTGNNTITVPDDAVAVTIIPIQPEDEEISLSLKKVAGDTGFGLHPTDPSSIGLASDNSSFVLNADGDNLSVRLIYN